MIFYLSEDLL